MIYEDDIFGSDIFKIMDRIFGRVDSTQGTNYTKYIDLKSSERQIDDDNIYYTISMPRLEENDFNVEVNIDTITIHINLLGDEDSLPLKTPKDILPEETKIKYNNGILDIIAPLDKNDDRD